MQVPRGTIIRPPSAPYTIRAPLPHGVSTTGQPTGTTTTAIRLTAAAVTSGIGVPASGGAGGAGTAAGQSTVQFVPVSLPTSGGATLRPATVGGASIAAGSSLPTVSFRPGSAGGAPAAIVTQRPITQPLDGSNVSNPAGTVRVTLVQSSGTIGKPSVSHATITQSPGQKRRLNHYT